MRNRIVAIAAAATLALTAAAPAFAADSTTSGFACTATVSAQVTEGTKVIQSYTTTTQPFFSATNLSTPQTTKTYQVGPYTYTATYSVTCNSVTPA